MQVGMIHGIVKKSVHTHIYIKPLLPTCEQIPKLFGTDTRLARPREDIIPGSQIPMNLAPHDGSGACGVKKSLYYRLSLILDPRRQVMTQTMRHTESKFNGTIHPTRPRAGNFVIPTR